MKVLTLFVAAGMVAVCPAVANPTPSIGWSSPSIVAHVVPGFPQQQQTEILIRAERDEDRIVSLLPSAELLPYVSALSPTIVDVPSDMDQSATITFTASLPKNTPPGRTVSGSIDVLLTDKSNRLVLERWSLPVSIRAVDLAEPELETVTLKEDCSNGLDDDGNGKADCQDSDCAREPYCHGGSCNGFGKIDHLQASQPEHCVSGGALQILYYSPVGQEFIPSSPELVAIELSLAPFNPPYADNLSVRIREGSIAGPILGTSGTEALFHPPAVNKLDIFWQRFVFPTPVSLVPGETYVYEVLATNASFGQYYVQTAIVSGDGTFSYGSCDYPGGVMVIGGFLNPALDQNFITCGSK
jgi:hypothetical protein